MSGVIIVDPGRIRELSVRAFDQPGKQFAGTSAGCTGQPDVGLPWFALVRFAKQKLGTPAGGSCAYIVSRAQQHQLDAGQQGFMEAEIARVKALPPVIAGVGGATRAQVDEFNAAYDRMLDFQGKLVKNDKTLGKVASDATIALNTFRACIKDNVLLLLEGHVTRNLTNPENALAEFLAEGERIYVGTAFNLKAQLMVLFRITGVASTVEELQLLLATYSHHKALATEVLHEGDPPVHRDNAVEDFKSKELQDMLLERMSSTSSALSAYRALVSKAIRKEYSYRWVLDEINKLIETDKPSLDHVGPAVAAHLAQEKVGRANHASFATDGGSSSHCGGEGGGSGGAGSGGNGSSGGGNGSFGGGGGSNGGGGQDAALAFAASAEFIRGFTLGVNNDPSKRQRLDTHDGEPCHFWDGRTCSRQEATGECKYAKYHTGTGSGGPGVARSTWFQRASTNRLRIAGTNGGVTNNHGQDQGVAAYAAAAYAAHVAQQQQDPWAAHHRQSGGGGPH